MQNAHKSITAKTKWLLTSSPNSCGEQHNAKMDMVFSSVLSAMMGQ